MKTFRVLVLVAALSFGAHGQQPGAPVSPAPAPRYPHPPPAPVPPAAGAQPANASRQNQTGAAAATNAPNIRLGLTNLATQTNLTPTGRNPATNAVADRAFSQRDQGLSVTIRQRIQTDIRIRQLAANAHFIVRDGVVTLVGTIPTAEDAQLLSGFVQQVPGVAGVTSQLTPGPSETAPAPVRAPAATLPPAPQSSVAIPLEKTQPTGVPSVQGVRLSEGLVLTETDRALFTKIRSTVQHEVATTGGDPSIEVFVQNGAVTLRGSATSADERRRITTAIEQIPGVTSVRDQLKISAPPTP